MTLDYMTNEIRQSLNPLLRIAVPERVFSRLVLICVRQCPIASLAAARPGSSVADGWAASAERAARAESGVLFWIFASILIRYIIDEIIKRWNANRINKAFIAGWREELQNVK